MKIFPRANAVCIFVGWLAVAAFFGLYVRTVSVRAQTGSSTNRLADQTLGPANVLDRPSPARGTAVAAAKSDVIGPATARPALAARSPQFRRFLGWNFARNQGSDYLKQFLRKKAHVASPMASAYGAHAAIGGTQNTRFAADQFSLNPATSPGFNFRASLPTDFLPTGVATGDLNGDGRIDWVVSNGGSNNVWVYMGKGDGTAALPTIVPLTGQSPSAVALADLRGIGILDLAVAEADSSAVEILLGNGDGTFGSGTLYPTPDPPSTLAVADFNGDGHLDIVVGMIDGDSIDPSVDTDAIAFLPGDGSGRFGPPVAWSNGNAVPAVTGLAVADLNGDGRPDLVVLEGFGGAPGVYALLGQGNGTFQQAYYDQHSSGIVNWDAIAVGDLNEDGHPDLVIIDSNGDANVALGNGDGTFAPESIRKIFGIGDTGFSAALVDLNGDGHLDLVAGSALVVVDPSLGLNAGDMVCVLLGDGAGNLSAAKVYRGEPGMFSLAVADLNGDGRPEVITANQDDDSTTVYLNDGHGGFGDPSGAYIGYLTEGVTQGVTNSPFSNFFFLDANGDGKPDLMLLERGDLGPDPYQITVLLNDGTGHFGAPIRSVGPGSASGIVGDLTFGNFLNAGTPDFVSLDTEFSNGTPFLTFAANNGGGTFSTPTTIQPASAQGIVAAGDFNKDGNLDLAVAGLSVRQTPELTIFLGHGDGTFTPGATYDYDAGGSEFFPALIYVGDFNRDGNLDVLVWDRSDLEGSTSDDLYEFLGNGSGTFSVPTIVIPNLGYFTLTDLNHDGNPDVVELAQPNPPSTGPPNFNIYLGKADGSFELTKSYSPYVNQFGSSFIFGKGGLFPGGGPMVADFNGDGIPDIAAFQVPEGTGHAIVQFLLGNGDGTFTPSFSAFNFGNSFTPQQAFDVDGDGRADLVEVDGYTSAYNIVRSVPGPTYQMRMTADPVIGANGDVNISLALPVSTPTTIALTTSDPAISIPASVTIPAGELTQDIDFQIANTFNSSHVFSIQGQLNTETEIVYGSQVLAQNALNFMPSLVNSTESAAAGGSTPDYGFQSISVNGYSTSLTLSCQGLPAGAICQFAENPLPLDAGLQDYSTLIVSVGAGVPSGSYPFSVRATDGIVTASVSATLEVGDFQILITPSTATTVSGGSLNFTVPVLSLSGYSQPVNLTCTNVPAGATCLLSSGSVTPQSPAFGDPLSIQVSSLPVGTYSFVVTATSGPLTHSVTGQFNVGDFSGSLSSTALTIAVGNQASSVITINSTNGLSGPVMLNCPSPPQGIGCSFSDGLPNLPANGSVSSTLTISVISKPADSAKTGSGFPKAPNAILIALLLLTVSLIVIETRQSTSRPIGIAARSLLLFFLAAMLSNCGGGGGGNGAGGSGGGGGAGGGGGGGSSVTVAVPVTAAFGSETKTIGTVSVTVP